MRGAQGNGAGGAEEQVSMRRVLPERGGEGEPDVLAVHLRNVLHPAGMGMVV